MLQCMLTAVGAKCKVSFDVPNSLASVLGFKRSIYGVGNGYIFDSRKVQLSVFQKVVLEVTMSCYLHQHKSTD